MSEKFNLEIISPNKSILKTNTSEVIIPCFEGEMGILKDHIPLITFLRPDIEKSHIDSLITEAEKKIIDDQISDKERYLLYYKINTLKNIS